MPQSDKNTFVNTKVLTRQINTLIKKSDENWDLLEAQQVKELSVENMEEHARLEGKKRVEEGLKCACNKILSIINKYED